MSKKKILIADDDEDILDSLSMLLWKEGFTVETTEHADTLLQADFVPPDLVLLDIRIGESDGRDICRQFKSNVRTKHTPVIIFSAAPEIKQSALDAGADDFLAK